jgi:hypothetical protein
VRFLSAFAAICRIRSRVAGNCRWRERDAVRVLRQSLNRQIACLTRALALPEFVKRARNGKAIGQGR